MIFVWTLIFDDDQFEEKYLKSSKNEEYDEKI